MIEWWTRAYVDSDVAVAHAYEVRPFRTAPNVGLCGHPRLARYSLSCERPTCEGDARCRGCVASLVARAFDEPEEVPNTSWRKKPMKHIIYECDWCGDKQPEAPCEMYPEGWSEFSEDAHALLCGPCHESALAAVKEAVGRAIMNVKQRRRDARDAAQARESQS